MIANCYFKICMDRLHVMSRWPYCGVQTMKRRSRWCTRKIMWVLNSFLIDLLHTGGLLIYSFKCMIISFSDLVSIEKYKRILTFKRGHKG